MEARGRREKVAGRRETFNEFSASIKMRRAELSQIARRIFSVNRDISHST
jgi:hypothetical protein